MRALLSKAYRVSSEVTAWGAAGFPLSAMREQRLAICAQCPNYQIRRRTCSLCGCFMPVKASIATSSCPEERWSNLTTAEPGAYQKHCDC